MKEFIPSKSSIYTISRRVPRAWVVAHRVRRQFRVSHQTRCNGWDTAILFARVRHLHRVL